MRITLIGSGNVATHLAAALKNAGHRIVQVYSRDAQHAALLAYHVKAEPVSDLQQINVETDLFIISVNDDAIVPVAKQLAKFKKLIVHTSGGTDLESLAAVILRAGVFYPLQTFSKEKDIDFGRYPCVLKASMRRRRLNWSSWHKPSVIVYIASVQINAKYYTWPLFLRAIFRTICMTQRETFWRITRWILLY